MWLSIKIKIRLFFSLQKKKKLDENCIIQKKKNTKITCFWSILMSAAFKERQRFFSAFLNIFFSKNFLHFFGHFSIFYRHFSIFLDIFLGHFSRIFFYFFRRIFYIFSCIFLPFFGRFSTCFRSYSLAFTIFRLIYFLVIFFRFPGFLNFAQFYRFLIFRFCWNFHQNDKNLETPEAGKIAFFL